MAPRCEIGDRHQIVAAENALVDPIDLLGKPGLAEAVLEKLLALLLDLFAGELPRTLATLQLDLGRGSGCGIGINFANVETCRPDCHSASNEVLSPRNPNP